MKQLSQDRHLDTTAVQVHTSNGEQEICLPGLSSLTQNFLVRLHQLPFFPPSTTSSAIPREAQELVTNFHRPQCMNHPGPVMTPGDATQCPHSLLGWVIESSNSLHTCSLFLYMWDGFILPPKIDQQWKTSSNQLSTPLSQRKIYVTKGNYTQYN